MNLEELLGKDVYYNCGRKMSQVSEVIETDNGTLVGMADGTVRPLSVVHVVKSRVGCLPGGASASLLEHIKHFAAENLVEQPDASVTRNEVYRAYEEFCDRHDLHPVSKISFSDKLQRDTNVAFRFGRNADRAMTLVGVRLVNR